MSASEIARLKLDADWVILSACNTAAGAAKSAEVLSGLGRAFIYAGARALLVSHWAVESDATVKLVTGAVHAMAGNTKVGRAEAMRRSMLTLIDKGSWERRIRPIGRRSWWSEKVRRGGRRDAVGSLPLTGDADALCLPHLSLNTGANQRRHPTRRIDPPLLGSGAALQPPRKQLAR
jgi:CHAT domain-containing protein